MIGLSPFQPWTKAFRISFQPFQVFFPPLVNSQGRLLIRNRVLLDPSTVSIFHFQKSVGLGRIQVCGKHIRFTSSCSSFFISAGEVITKRAVMTARVEPVLVIDVILRLLKVVMAFSGKKIIDKRDEADYYLCGCTMAYLKNQQQLWSTWKSRRAVRIKSYGNPKLEIAEITDRVK